MLSIKRSLSIKQGRDNEVFVIIAAAGTSWRFGGGLPKQFYSIGGVSPLRRVIDLFLSLNFISGIVCVIPKGFEEKYKAIISDIKDSRLKGSIHGGSTRMESIRKGLKAIKSFSPKYILIHDAARCFCNSKIIENIYKKLESGAKAVLPTIRATDSVRFDGIGIDRNKVEFSQTPQGFEYDLIAGLHEKYKGKDFSDDVSLCDLEKIKVDTIPGDIANKKITFKSDIVEQRQTRTGFGYDAHKFSNDPTRKLFIMGKEIPNHKGLKGVSDADVGIHSLVDAILGALCAGSIGDHFPENDSKNKGADSKNFLIYCKELLSKRNAEIINIDTTIVCESPKISLYSNDMKEIIASCLEISGTIINIKGKTTEGMGFEGRKEGISAMSLITIRLPV